jgi:hypothetical protein
VRAATSVDAIELSKSSTSRVLTSQAEGRGFETRRPLYRKAW